MGSSAAGGHREFLERFHDWEARVESLARRILIGAAQRLPMTLAAIVHSLLLLAAPPQLVEIVSAMAVERSILLWAVVLLFPVAAAPLHLILLGRYAKPSRFDVVFAFFPAFALTIMAFRWGDGAWWIMLPLVLLALTAAFWVLPRIVSGGRSPRRVAVITVLVLFAVLAAFSIEAPIGMPRAIGPLAVVAWGISLLSLLIGVAMLRPILASVYLAICLAAAQFSPGSRPVELLPAKAPAAPTDANEFTWAMHQWLKARPDLDAYRKAGRPYPVVIASAEGGGAYAAAHAFLTLSAMQEMCPSFPNHLFATVGVSGGSIGTLVYAGEMAPKNARLGPRPCRFSRVQPPIAPVTQDLLSPPLANLLFVQPLEFLIPLPQLFQDSGDVIADAIGELVPGNARLRAPLGASWDPQGAQPVTLFVTTNVREGNRLIIAPLEDAAGEASLSFPNSIIQPRRDIRANVAAFISARFPWLTPTARLEIAPGRTWLLADGGYFENSGAETALDLLNQIRLISKAGEECLKSEALRDLEVCKCPVIVQTQYAAPADWSGCRTPVFLAYMPIIERLNYTQGFYQGEQTPVQSYLLDPLSTMLRVRSIRGVDAVVRARESFEDSMSWTRTEEQKRYATGLDQAYFPHMLPIPDMALPLGWKLSERRARQILAVSASPAACNSVTGIKPTPTQLAVSENACQMRRLGALLDPAADPATFGTSPDADLELPTGE